MRVVFAAVAKDAAEWEASSETADLQKILKVPVVDRWLSPAHQAEYILLDVSIWGHIISLIGDETAGTAAAYSNEYDIRRVFDSRRKALVFAVTFLVSKINFNNNQHESDCTTSGIQSPD